MRAPTMADGIGARFQDDTKYHRDRMPGGGPRFSERPDPYKTYPGAARVELPDPEPGPDAALHDALGRRKSVRDFADDPLALGQLSYLLWASAGEGRSGAGHTFRPAPSAGALYPIETYVAANRVADLPAGVYHYAVHDHELEELARGDPGRRLAGAALGQAMCARAAATFIWTALFRRSTWKYRQRGYRYVYLEAGHVAQNLALAAVALGLGTCQIGALFDDEVNDLVGADGAEESVLYMSVVGAPSYWSLYG
ncbi:MAG: SagB/ThcOx family dehydrogenase [Planctomycetota bacterium]